MHMMEGRREELPAGFRAHQHTSLRGGLILSCRTVLPCTFLDLNHRVQCPTHTIKTEKCLWTAQKSHRSFIILANKKKTNREKDYRNWKVSVPKYDGFHAACIVSVDSRNTPSSHHTPTNGRIRNARNTSFSFWRKSIMAMPFYSPIIM